MMPLLMVAPQVAVLAGQVVRFTGHSVDTGCTTQRVASSGHWVLTTGQAVGWLAGHWVLTTGQLVWATGQNVWVVASTGQTVVSIGQIVVCAGHLVGEAGHLV